MKNITFISASAGSGKTYQLTRILVDWIKSRKCNANEVMLTTFSDKASSEIHERSHASLLENKLFNESSKLNEAYIGTVHSVGYKFVKKYWYLLNISPEIKQISEIESNVFFSNSIVEVPNDDELRELIQLNYNFNFQSFENNFSSYNPNKWKEDILDLIKRSLINQVDFNDEESLQISLDKINRLFNGNIDDSGAITIIKQISDIIDNNTVDNKPYKEVKEEWKIVSTKLNLNNLNIRDLVDVFKVIEKLKKAYKAKKYSEILALLPTESLEDFDIVKKSAIRYTELVFDVAKRSVDAYQSFKKEKGLVDYTDMEVYFLQLLDNDIVKDEITKSIKLVMVDEFQDSNPIQLSIFMKLSDLVEKSYWVGDPKQAIYGFRGTDPLLIEKVINEFTKPNDKNLNIELLKMSWRSLPTLVNLSNTIFSKRLSTQVSDIYISDKEQLRGEDDNQVFLDWKNSVETNPLPSNETISLIPVSKNKDSKSGGHINFWQFLKESDNGNIVITTLEESYNLLSDKIQETLDNNSDLKASDICVLMTNNNHVKALAEVLKGKGIAVNSAIEGLKDTVEFRIIKNIVALFLDKNNALSITELDFIAGDNNDVNKAIEDRLKFVISLLEKQNEDASFSIYKHLTKWLEDSEIKKLVIELKKQSYILSVSNTIQKIVNHFNIFQKLLSFEYSEVRHANIDRILELANSYEDYALKMGLGTSLAGFFSFIDIDDNNNQQAVPISNDAVNVMTYHKSKGLEWKHVILSSLDKDFLDEGKLIKRKFFSTKEKYAQSINLDQPLENRQIEFSFWAFGKLNSISDLLKEAIVESDEYKLVYNSQSDESSRLMYVGITRAGENLSFVTNKKKGLPWLENIILDWNFENIYKSNGLETTLQSTLDIFNLGIDVNYQKFVKGEYSYTAKQNNTPSRLYFDKHIPDAQNKNYRISPSGEKSLSNIVVENVVNLHQRLKTSTSDAQELGNTLHQSLYLKDRSYFEESLEKNVALSKTGINKIDFVENTKVFNKYLVDKYKPVKLYPEYYLEQIIGSQLVVGEADLVLETENGLILIDFKSYSGKEENITDTSSEFYGGKYSGQLNLYKQMLETEFDKPVIEQLIYYVVLGKLIELKEV